MRYRDPPGGDGDPIVEATIAEVYALRRKILACLARWGVPRRDRDDLFQQVAIITWMALREGRVRGSAARTPRESLLAFMSTAAMFSRQNYRRRKFRRAEFLAAEPDREPGRTPDTGAWARPVQQQLEARELLRRIATHPKVAQLLLLAALDVPATSSYHLGKARRWICAVFESQEPLRLPPPRPRNRKRRR